MRVRSEAHSLLCLMVLGLCACAGGGGGGHHGGGGGGGGGNNPTPTITSLAPTAGFTADASSGAASQMLTINGTNFVNGATVSWSGTQLAGVTLVNSGQLTVPVTPDLLAFSYTAGVLVTNPAPGGGASNAVNFPVNPPVPGAPTFAPAGSAAELSGGFDLAVTATGVLYDSEIVWNYGKPGAFYTNTALTAPPAAPGGAGTLTAIIPNGLLANQGVVPVAIVNFNADGSISNAVSQANFTVGAPVAPACLLAGSRNYVFVAGGADKNGAVSMAGTLRIDATGTVVGSNSYMDFKDPSSLFTASPPNAAGQISSAAGACTLPPAGVPGVGTVTFTVNGIPGDTFTLNYGLRNAGNVGRITLTDTLYNVNATGHLQIQYNPKGFSIGSFAFGLLGESAASQRLAVIGAMCPGGQQNFLQADFNEAGTVISKATVPAGWAGSATDPTTGRFITSQLVFSNGAPALYLTVYGVGGGKAFAIESSPVGTSKQVLSGQITGFKGMVCMPTGFGGIGTFSNSSVTSSVFGLTTEGGGTSAAILGVVNGIAPGGGGSCAAGQGSASLTADENMSGVGGTISAAPACYQMDSTGRAVLTYTDPLTAKAESGTFYLDGTGGGYLFGQGASVPFGFIGTQAAPAPLPAIGGTYSFGVFNLPATPPLPVTSITIDAATTTSGTLADNTTGGSCNGAPCAYTLDTTTGRATATLNSATTFGGAPVVLYEAASNQIYIMDAIPTATPVMGALLQ